MQWKVKEIEDAAQKGNNLEASWGPREVSPVLPPPLSGPAAGLTVK